MKEKEEKNKRKDIVLAAEKNFLLYGYAGSRTTAIAKDAGVTHAMLHYYFNTKSELYDYVLNIEIKKLAKSFDVAFKNNDLPLLERLSLAIEAHFDILAQSPEIPLFLINQVISNPSRVELVIDRYSKVIALLDNNFKSDIEEGVKKGELKPIDITQLFVSILSLNVMVFIMSPMLTGLLDKKGEDLQTFLSARRHENVQTIINRLKV